MSSRQPARMTMRMADDWFHTGVGELIRQNREDRGLSVRELAAKCGVSHSTVSNAEIGQACSFLTAVRIAEALELTVDDLAPVKVGG